MNSLSDSQTKWETRNLRNGTGIRIKHSDRAYAQNPRDRDFNPWYNSKMRLELQKVICKTLVL